MDPCADLGESGRMGTNIPDTLTTICSRNKLGVFILVSNAPTLHLCLGSQAVQPKCCDELRHGSSLQPYHDPGLVEGSLIPNMSPNA